MKLTSQDLKLANRFAGLNDNQYLQDLDYGYRLAKIISIPLIIFYVIVIILLVWSVHV